MRVLRGGFLLVMTVIPLGLPLVPACGSAESSSFGDAATDGASPADGPSTGFSSNFDQSCATNTDCVAVEDDTPCCNICLNATVNRSALPAFNAERARQASLCTTRDRQCALPACNTADHAACSGGRCVFVRCSGPVCPDADSGVDATAG